jgi:hypothetical protein
MAFSYQVDTSISNLFARGLLDGKAPGQPSKLDDGQRQAIARIIESGAIPAIHGIVR